MRSTGRLWMALGALALSCAGQASAPPPDDPQPVAIIPADAAPAPVHELPPPDAGAPDAGAADAGLTSDTVTLNGPGYGEPESPPPEITADNRCKRDSDCFINEYGGCGGPCGSCPGGTEALNRHAFRRGQRECAKERREWQRKKHRHRGKDAHCSACPRSYYTSARCERGACVLAGFYDHRKPPDIDSILGASKTGRVSLSRSQVTQVVGPATARFRKCVDQHPSASGVVRMTINVGPDGVVKSARASIKGQLGDCLARVARSLRFAKAQGPTRFVYPVRVKR